MVRREERLLQLQRQVPAVAADDGCGHSRCICGFDRYVALSRCRNHDTAPASMQQDASHSTQAQQRVREGPPALRLRVGHARARHSIPCLRGANASLLVPSSAHPCTWHGRNSACQHTARRMQCAHIGFMLQHATHHATYTPACGGSGRVSTHHSRSGDFCDLWINRKQQHCNDHKRSHELVFNME